MTPTSAAPGRSSWFLTLLDTAEEVYFRYSLNSARGFAYLSPSIEHLTGHSPDTFYADPSLCVALIPREDRRVVRQILRARRGLQVSLRLVRDGECVPLDVRTVPITLDRRVVAIEGVARPSRNVAASTNSVPTIAPPEGQPTQARLAALMYEVHDLLHRVLPPSAQRHEGSSRPIRLGDLVFDPDRLTVTEAGKPVSLTSRETMVLRYLLQRPGRVITRGQLLTDVWGNVYTGDDRTVDVHISRLRRKLPSLATRLVAVKHLGYRLDADHERVA